MPILVEKTPTYLKLKRTLIRKSRGKKSMKSIKSS
nr:MAG TPA: hypothetical protein [Bacteriophage sp.]